MCLFDDRRAAAQGDDLVLAAKDQAKRCSLSVTPSLLAQIIPRLLHGRLAERVQRSRIQIDKRHVQPLRKQPTDGRLSACTRSHQQNIHGSFALMLVIRFTRTKYSSA